MKVIKPGGILILVLFLLIARGSVQAQTSTGNLALSKPIASVSSVASGSSPALAIDDNPETFWASGGGGVQWIAFDLGDNFRVGRVVVKWGGAKASNYQIEFSTDGAGYTTVWQDLSGDFDSVINKTGRYLLIRTKSDDNSSRYELASLEVYQAALLTPTPTIAVGEWSGVTVIPTVGPTLGPTGSITVIPGDSNRDNKIDLYDLSVMMSRFNKASKDGQIDLNNDNKIDQADYEELVKLLIKNKRIHPRQ